MPFDQSEVPSEEGFDLPALTPSQVALEVKNLWVRRGGKYILKDVSFKVPRGKFVGIIGPNGAGKTTLLRAIAGERPTWGQVFVNGESLYDSPEYWLQQIGYIPVDNILHEQLTVWQALNFIGQLRLPNEAAESIKGKVDSLLTEFEFPPNDRRRHRKIKDLSTGERKRVNICAELLTSPQLLLLDEPTSNLDPDAERSLMERLRERAHQNHQTLLLVTHTLNTIRECDQILFIENSTLHAIGDPYTILRQLEDRRNQGSAEQSDFYRWANVFDHYKTDEEKREREKIELPTGPVLTSAEVRSEPPVSQWRQFSVLFRRYFRVRLNEWHVLVTTLALGFIGGFFLFVLPENSFDRPDPSEFDTRIVAAREAVFILALIVVLIGLIAGFREISKEFRIYRHERLKGISPLAYFLSKWVWLAVAVGIIAPAELMLMLFVQGQPYPSTPWNPQTVVTLGGVTLILTCIAALTLGLAISAIAGNENVATVLLALAVIFHVLLSGLVRNRALENVINTLSALATSRWGVEGFASSLSFYCWATVKRFDEFNSYGHLVSVWLSLMAYVLVGIGVSVIALYLRDPWINLRGVAQYGVAHCRMILILVGLLIFILSWALFLREQSQGYYSLTYPDRFYGGIRFARIEYVENASSLQRLDGYISQSQCGAPEE